MGTILQMLGMNVTFWNLDGSSDLLESSLLEGFTIISIGLVLSPMFRPLYSCDTVSLKHRFSPTHLYLPSSTSGCLMYRQGSHPGCAHRVIGMVARN
jgi:hypothetical protein